MPELQISYHISYTISYHHLHQNNKEEEEKEEEEEEEEDDNNNNNNNTNEISVVSDPEHLSLRIPIC